MKISIIVAMDEKRGIGKDNKIPWHIKEDLIKLRNLTKDHVVILGRKTYDSMIWYYNRSGNPMPGKMYIVVTHDRNYKPARENAVTADSVQAAIKKASSYCHSEFISESRSRNPSASLRAGKFGMTYKQVRHDNECGIFVIGGGQIYQQALPYTDRLYLTTVEGDYNCDTFFSDYSEFKKVISEEKKESESYKYKFLELEKG